jgi:hypothetical protein
LGKGHFVANGLQCQSIELFGTVAKAQWREGVVRKNSLVASSTTEGDLDVDLNRQRLAVAGSSNR